MCFAPSVIGYTELQEGEGLSVNTDMTTIVKTMAAPDSGLDIRDRMWLKITIPNAFIGRLATKFVAYFTMHFLVLRIRSISLASLD